MGAGSMLAFDESNKPPSTDIDNYMQPASRNNRGSSNVTMFRPRNQQVHETIPEEGDDEMEGLDDDEEDLGGAQEGIVDDDYDVNSTKSQ